MKTFFLPLFLSTIFSIGLIAQEIKLTPSDPATEDSFGWTVCIEGDVLCVGNVYDDDNNIQSGSAYVFNWNGTEWVESQKLLPSDGGYAQYFGYYVAMDGNNIIVGAYRGNDDMNVEVGSAYIYTYNGTAWQEAAILQPPNGEYDDRFGQCVDINGDYALVGANGDDDLGNDCGAAYLYKFDGSDWQLQEKLVPADLQPNDIFGSSVTISDDYLLVGAIANDDQGDNSGKVYAYSYNGSGYDFHSTITPNDPSADQYFGRGLSVDGNLVGIGAYHDDVYGENSGSAYIFEFNGSAWVQHSKLIPPDGNAGDLFGVPLQLEGTDIMIGARYFHDGMYTSGGAYYFTEIDGIWEHVSTVRQPESVSGAQFGMSVGVSEGKTIIGCPFDDVNGYRSGSAYVYSLDVLMNIENQNILSAGYSVNPTVTSGWLNIKRTSLSGEETTIDIVGVNGVVAETHRLREGQSEISIDISELTSGVYVVRMYSDNHTVMTKKIVLK